MLPPITDSEMKVFMASVTAAISQMKARRVNLERLPPFKGLHPSSLSASKAESRRKTLARNTIEVSSSVVDAFS